MFSVITLDVFYRYSFPFGRPEGAMKATLSLLERVSLHSMAHPRKPPYRHKNIADISNTDQVIAHFVSNFVAVASREGPG